MAVAALQVVAAALLLVAVAVLQVVAAALLLITTPNLEKLGNEDLVQGP